jgi:transposase
VHDCQEVLALVDAIPPVAGRRGRPRRRPAKAHGDKGYDYPFVRRGLRQRHIIARIARRGIESRERLGRYRWVVERTLAWLHRLKRLRTREERGDEMHAAFLQLGCDCVLFRQLERSL